MPRLMRHATDSANPENLTPSQLITRCYYLSEADVDNTMSLSDILRLARAVPTTTSLALDADVTVPITVTEVTEENALRTRPTTLPEVLTSPRQPSTIESTSTGSIKLAGNDGTRIQYADFRQRSAMLLSAHNGYFILTVGSQHNESWIISAKPAADGVLKDHGYQRTSSWAWSNGFLSCDLGDSNADD
jgi:hypothetical protein